MKTVIYESDAVVFYKDGPVAVLHLKPSTIELMASLDWKDTLFSHLQELEQDPSVTAVLYLSEKDTYASSTLDAARKRVHERIVNDALANRGGENDELLYVRELNMFSQYLLLAARYKKVTVSGLFGEVACPFIGLSLVADLRLASESTWFNFGAMRATGSPGGGLAYFLPKYLGRGRAMELLLTRDKLPADEAKEIGLVSEILPDHDFHQATVERVKELTKSASGIIAKVRSLMISDIGDLEHFLAEEIRVQRALLHDRMNQIRKEAEEK